MICICSSILEYVSIFYNDKNKIVQEIIIVDGKERKAFFSIFDKN